MDRQHLLDRLDQMDRAAFEGGGADRVARLHAAGRLTARERVEALLDTGSFVELDRLVAHQCRDFGMEAQRVPGDGVVTGYGRVEGRQVYVFAQDFTVFGGSLSSMHARKICKVMDLAMQNGAPVVGLNDSGGARIQEGVESLGGYADIFLRNTLASGVVPQISAILGPCAGGAVYSPAITDFVAMVEGSYMFVTGPDVVKTVTQEEVTKEALGGATTHNARSGVAHFKVPDEAAMIALLRELLSYVPQNNMEEAPRRPTADPADRPCPELIEVVPTNPNKPYDMHEVIRAVADEHRFLEVHAHYAKNMIIGFARIEIDLGRQADNQEKIILGAQRLIEAVSQVIGHVAGVGKGLKSAAESHAKLVGSINTRLLPRQRALAGLGVRQAKQKDLPGNLPSLQVVMQGTGDLIEGESEEIEDAPALTDQSGAND